MSTRRARIKAVAVLPPRRKNADISDGNKKPAPFKESAELLIKSPKPALIRATSPVIKSPVQVSVIKSPFPVSPKPKPIPTLTEVVTSPNITIPSTVKSSDKDLVVISKSPVPIFTPPLNKNSPNRKPTLLIVSNKNAVSSSDSLAKKTDERKKDCEVQQGISDSLQSPAKSINENSEVDSLSKNVVNTPSVSDTNGQGEEDNVPESILSIPESVAEDADMDGIIPLKSASTAPKPIQLLNEITSENAEVLFDPIVPLPSPSKVRPKLRPIPRLGPHRRNSIQGSASESEDESRRALLGSGNLNPTLPLRPRHDSHTSHSTQPSVSNREASRIRNDSVCSNVSQIQPPAVTSPVKDKHLTKARRQEMSKRMYRRRKETTNRALTMYDLIFFNPTSNPIVPDQDEIKAKEANAKDEAERNAKTQESEEDADDPPESDAAPVPQIKLGPNGEIVLDEKSLVIKQSETRKVSSVVREGSWGGGGGRYTRSARTADWSAAETVRFYRALAAVGTDFSLMAQLFPDRGRRDLKLKFKKEERHNGAQVDKALRSATSWDVAQLQIDFKQEREEAARKAEAEKKRLFEEKKAEKERLKVLRDLKHRQSRGSKAIENSVKFNTKSAELTTADEFIQRALEAKAQQRKRKAAARKDIEIEITEPPPNIEIEITKPPPEFATLTLINKKTHKQSDKNSDNDLATISKLDPKTGSTTNNVTSVPEVPSNIETGSLVVLRVNDPKSPSKTMLQTYIARGAGKLTPIALPPTFLNSVVGYMKIGTPKSTGSASSPQILSPSTSEDSRSQTPGCQADSGPGKRQRNSSYTITQL